MNNLDFDRFEVPAARERLAKLRDELRLAEAHGDADAERAVASQVALAERRLGLLKKVSAWREAQAEATRLFRGLVEELGGFEDVDSIADSAIAGEIGKRLHEIDLLVDTGTAAGVTSAGGAGFGEQRRAVAL